MEILQKKEKREKSISFKIDLIVWKFVRNPRTITLTHQV